MQVLNRRGMNGLPQDLVAGATSMLGTSAIQDESWPYWWSVPRSNAQFVQKVASIPTPAQGVSTVVTSLVVPPGFCFVMRAIRQNFATGNSPSPFVEGSGDILWTIDVSDAPAPAISLSGYSLPDMALMADERGSKISPWPVEGYTVFEQYQHIRYKVITTANIPVGAPNFITCGFFGWWEKMIQPQK